MYKTHINIIIIIIRLILLKGNSRLTESVSTNVISRFWHSPFAIEEATALQEIVAQIYFVVLLIISIVIGNRGE